MNIYTPFTYLIGWKKHDIWYYGVRYAQYCHPKDMWNNYFTSSKYVQQFREKNGEPDVIEIRKTFNNKKDAIEWETKVLTRLNVNKNNKWLNRTVNGNVTHKHMFGGEMQRNLALKRIERGTHNLTEWNNSRVTCPHCGKIGQKRAMKRWHFEKCKENTN